MATSGSYDFTATRDSIIQGALRLIGALAQGETPATAATTEAAEALNLMVKAWASDGMPLWALKQGWILPVSSTNDVSAGPTGGHFTNSYVSTTTSVAAVSGATTITLTSVTGVANNYYIGILLDDTTMQWTTVSGAPSGSVVTLATALTDDVAAGNRVYCYQTKAQRPLRVIGAWAQYQSTSQRYPLNYVTKDQFRNLGYLGTASVPNQITYDPQLDNGTFSFFPRISGGDLVIEVRYQVQFQDFDASSDTPDFPQEWHEALKYGLAVRLAPEYGMPPNDRSALFKEAALVRELALNNGTEEGSILFMPDARWSW